MELNWNLIHLVDEISQRLLNSVRLKYRHLCRSSRVPPGNFRRTGESVCYVYTNVSRPRLCLSFIVINFSIIIIIIIIIFIFRWNERYIVSGIVHDVCVPPRNNRVLYWKVVHGNARGEPRAAVCRVKVSARWYLCFYFFSANWFFKRFQLSTVSFDSRLTIDSKKKKN